MSWKPEVFVEDKWSQNELVFATEHEAKTYAYDLFLRWISCEDSRAVKSDKPVNYRYEDRKLIAVEAGDVG